MTTNVIAVDLWQDTKWVPLPVRVMTFPGGEPHAKLEREGRFQSAGLGRRGVLRCESLWRYRLACPTTPRTGSPRPRSGRSSILGGCILDSVTASESVCRNRLACPATPRAGSPRPQSGRSSILGGCILDSVTASEGASLCGQVVRIDARVGSMDDLGRMLVAADLVRRLGAAEVHLFCPYLPGARQDRGAPLTAKLFADWILAAGLDSVVGVDPHSDVMPALLGPRFSAIDVDELFPADALGGLGLPGPADAVLVCPDAGAEKRVARVARRFGYGVVHGRKLRDPHTGALSGFACEPLPTGMAGIVVDDICDGGGTFVGLADALGADRDRLHLFTTHGIYSRDLAPLRARFATIASTDSFPIGRTPDGVVRLALRDLPAFAARYTRPAPSKC